MKYWFTSDCHFGHNNIIGYCNRPFKDLADMNEKLINNWNARVKKEDTVFHLGDFCFRNTPATAKEGEGDIHPATYYESLLNGKVIQIQGSHDDNNSCKTPIKFMVIEYGGKRFLLLHDPADIPIAKFYDAVLCGHVHQQWKTNTFKSSHGYVPILNVGVDVWGYRPISINEILACVKEEI